MSETTREVAFDAAGVTLRARLDLPAGRAPFPAVVMAPGFGGVKEQLLDRYGEVFTRAGLAALRFDPRGFGASDGEPRQEVEAWRQVDDWRHALTFAATLKELRGDRLAVWGTSWSGGHALVVGALDRRVRAVVAQVPFVSGHAMALRRVRPELRAGLRAEFDGDRRKRFSGAAPARLPLVAQRPGQPCAIPGEDAWRFFEALRAGAPGWRNEITLRSLEASMEYEPGVYAPRVSPTPLLVIAAADDDDSPTDLVLDAYARALEPKRLCLLPCRHFEVYTRCFEAGAQAARDFLLEALRE